MTHRSIIRLFSSVLLAAVVVACGDNVPSVGPSTGLLLVDPPFAGVDDQVGVQRGQAAQPLLLGLGRAAEELDDSENGSYLGLPLVMALGLMKINRYSLPNVLANEPIVPELMQGQCTAENLERALLAWFTDAEARSTLEPRFLAIHQRLRGDASATAAAAVAELLQRPR